MDTLHLLKNLIEIPSPFYHEEEILRFLEDILNKMGFSTGKQRVVRWLYENGSFKKREDYNLIAQKENGKKKSFLLYGHVDTVPPVDEWYRLGLDPYKATLKGENMYGLGSYDMKGGIAALLKAVERIDVYSLPFNIKMCFGIDEENESAGAYSLINSDFIKDCVGCIVPEVGSGNLEPALGNVLIGRHGRFRVALKIVGKPAHASTPEYIVNPIKYALHTIENIEKEIDLGNDVDFPKGNISIGGIYALAEGLSSPEDCILLIDNIFSPPQTCTSILEQYKNILAKLQRIYGVGGLPSFEIINLTKLDQIEKYTPFIHPRHIPFMDPWKIDSSHPLVESALEAFRNRGIEPHLTHGKSNADENFIGNVVPTIVLPPLGGGEHQGGEFVNVKSVEDLSFVVKDVILEYGKRI